MKIKLLIFSILCTCFVSCIKEEALFREADIERNGFSLKEEGIVTNVLYGQNVITVTVNDLLEIINAEVTPIIKVSSGATISPESGVKVKIDDTKLAYIVTAQNGTQKPYIINFVPSIPLSFDFEDWSVNKVNQNKPFDYLTDPHWASGNPGVRIMIDAGKEFPTRKTTESYGGKFAALLETQYGIVSPGTVLHTPIFAGSLFRGIFDTNLKDPVTSVKFGQSHTKDLGRPMLFTGYYKYKAGYEYQNEVPEPVPGKVDECDIYAVLFKVTKGDKGVKEYLTARDVKTSNKIIATAMLDDWLQGGTCERDNYTRFEIPFTYTEDLDYENNDYKLAVVFTSSKDGAFFRGAVGSILHIDNVDIICQPIKK